MRLHRRSAGVLLALLAVTAACSDSEGETAALPTSTPGAKTGAGGAGEGLVVVPGEETVEATVSRIRQAIEAGGAKILAVVDHAAAAAEVGLDLHPTTLVIFGNPAAGTPLMQAAPTVAIDLPLKILVWQDDRGTVQVGYNDPSDLADRHGIAGQDERLASLAVMLRKLATGANG